MSKKRAAASVVDNNNGGEIKAKKAATVDICDVISTILKRQLQQAMRQNVDFEDELVKFSCSPFPHCIIKNFISDECYLEKLKESLLKQKFHEKTNDLFQFQQTRDLGYHGNKEISTLREVLFEQLRPWLADVIDVKLNDTIDMSCAKYNYTDFLLCHDDQLDDRVVAFIYYLLPNDWSVQDGGCLDLFSVDDLFNPDEVVASIVPCFNSLLFFEVSEKSFHQVAEVLTSTKSRLTVSGWFHGERKKKYSAPVSNEIQLHFQPALTIEDEVLLKWINPTYLNAEIVNDISEQFEENSEIQLSDFLIESKYQDLMKELNDESVDWNMKRPANKRSYFITTDTDKNASLLKGFCQFLKSTPFFKLLSKFTGLKLALLHEDDVSDESSSSRDRETNAIASTCVEVQKWTPGCYTLLNDDGQDSVEEYMLDVFLHLLDDDWDSDECGGSVNYLIKESGQELLSVSPISNCLSLVYRDLGTSRFIKYVNNRAVDKTLYNISAVYKENGKT